MEEQLEYEYDDVVDERPAEYAGFWMRVAAYLIDAILIGIVASVFAGVFGFASIAASGGLEEMVSGGEPNMGALMALLGAYALLYFVMLVGGWLYFAFMESGKNQATLGKMAVGIRVTDMYGDRISFGRATGRYFGKIVSGLIMYIGFIMVAFTDRKQGLHDMMANCLVLRK